MTLMQIDIYAIDSVQTDVIKNVDHASRANRQHWKQKPSYVNVIVRSLSRTRISGSGSRH
jgi:hypothetical protein